MISSRDRTRFVGDCKFLAARWPSVVPQGTSIARAGTRRPPGLMGLREPHRGP